MIPRQKAGVKLQFSQSTKNGAILHKGKALRQSLRFTAFSTSLYSDKPAACLHEPSLSGKAAKSCRNKGGFDTSSVMACAMPPTLPSLSRCDISHKRHTPFLSGKAAKKF